jgi:hypothetical protein
VDIIEGSDILDISIRDLWQQQRRLIQLKEEEIVKATVTRNYGENFLLEEYNLAGKAEFQVGKGGKEKME